MISQKSKVMQYPDIVWKFLKNKRAALHKDGGRLEILMYFALAVTVYFYLHLANVYLTLTNQYIVGWSSILVLLILKRIERFKKPPLRIVFVALCVFLTIRYWIWRTTETLVYTGPLDFVAMMILYLAEFYALVIHLLGIFGYIWPLENKIMPLPLDTSLYPSVDIFIPTYNEPIEIVKVTAIAALGIDYPKDKLNIYILNDGSTLAKRSNPDTSQEAWARHYDLRRIARKIGVNYITRETNKHAKAGNLNHALNHTGSDLVLVLDCDHVPARDILKSTVGWFLKDEKIAFIQTPHFFINPNPVEKNLAIFKDAPSENDMFYRASHPGLDLWNSSFFCGSAAILKRNYLEEVGGISGQTITEDCETAFSLHKKGLKSVFIARPMVCGLSPETLDDFIIQRSRWAQGMIQIFILNNPLIAKGLKLYQKVSYFNLMIYWFFGFARFIFYVAPAAFLLFGLKIFFASVSQVLAYAVPHVVASIILMDFFYGKFRWPFFSELFENIQSLFLIPVVISVFINPRKPTFKVTPKGKSLENEFLSRLALPFFLLSLVLMATVPAAIVKWFKYPLFRDVTIISIVWSLFNLALAMSSFGAFFEKRQVRRHYRMWTKGKALVTLPRLNKTVEADIEDISLSGAGVVFKLPYPLTPLEHIILEARNSHGEKFVIEARVQREIKKGDKYVCGCEFLVPKDVNLLSTNIRFAFGDSQRWMDFWGQKTKPANPLWVMLFIIKSSFKGFKSTFIALNQFILIPAANYIRPFLTHGLNYVLKFTRPVTSHIKPMWEHLKYEMLLAFNYIKRFLNSTYRLISRSET